MEGYNSAPKVERGDSGLENRIRQASDFGELFETLEQAGGLVGSDGFHYTVDHLKSLIEDVRSGQRSENYITRTSGLREQVIKLVTLEKEASGSDDGARRSSRIESAEKPVRMPKVGDSVSLKKVTVHSGQASMVANGSKLEGILLRQIEIGECVFVSGSQTSPVRAIRAEGGKLVIDTMTSTYEVSEA